MLQIIRFLEEDVDGCGTDIEAMISIETDFALTFGHKKRLSEAVEEAKEELEEWDTDTLINIAMEKVFGEQGEAVYPDIEVIF